MGGRTEGGVITYNVRHNNITRIIYHELIQSENLILNPPEITKIDDQELWYDVKIKTRHLKNTDLSISL